MSRAPHLLVLEPGAKVYSRGQDHIFFNTTNGQWMCVGVEGKSYLERFRRPTDPGHIRIASPELPEELSLLVHEARKRGILIEPNALSQIHDSTIIRRDNKSKFSNFTWHITQRCNLSCRHCYYYPRPHPGKDLTENECLSVVDQLPDLMTGGCSITMSGGEPFLAPHFISILERIKTMGYHFTILSNGTLIDEECASRLSFIQPDFVQVSLDGSEEVSHEYQRGIGTFSKTLAGIRNLVTAGVNVIISMTVTRKNCREIDCLVSLGHRLGVFKFHFPHYQIRGRGKQNEADLSLSEAEQIAFLDTVRELDNSRHAEVGFVQLRRTSFLEPKIPAPNCGIGSTIFMLDGDGSVYPCSSLDYPEFRLGTVRENSLREILLDNPTMTSLSSLSATNRNQNCRKCDFRIPCNGGCVARAYAVNRDLREMDPFCPAFKRDYLEALWSVATSTAT